MNNFPMQQLAIIGPTLFIILMILIPVLGFVGGWKRAVYWGGGNFIFFALGLGVWFACNHAIGSLLIGLIQSMTKDILTDAQAAELAASMAAPVFFIVHILIANLILLLVYLIWFRKWAKLGKHNKEKWAINKAPLSARIGRNAIGAVALPVLMLPTTFTLTQGILFATTSQQTRAHNKTARDLYNGLTKISDAFSWFSYYGITDSARNYDGLYSTLSLNNTTITEFGEEKIDTPAMEALCRTIQNDGFDNFFTTLNSHDWHSYEDEWAGAQELVPQFETFATNWNTILKQTGKDINALFSSSVITEAIIDILNFNTQDIGKIEDPLYFDVVYGVGGGFEKAVNSYKLGTWRVPGKGEIEFPDIVYQGRIAIPKKAYNNLVKGMKQFYDITAIRSFPDRVKIFNQRIDQLVNFVFDKK